MFGIATLSSPLGPLTVAEVDGVLLGLTFDDTVAALRHRLEHRVPDHRPVNGVDQAISSALAAYFDGDLAAIDALRVNPAGTPFQLRVWSALRRIGARQTCSYKALAAAVARPDAVRAVGAANGANPIAIVIPCHRVVGSNGRLVGYGGGLDRKRWLLAHEGVLPASLPIGP